MKLKPCPKCGCPDELCLDSSRYAEASWIECHDCGHRVQESCPEEIMARRWNKLDRSAMPVYVPIE
jgi:hypothetical protein